MKVSPFQNDFSGGELGPLSQARADADRYRISVDQCINWIPATQGPVFRRPGSYFVKEVKDSSKPTVLVPFFITSSEQYILEFSPGKIRAYADGGIILDSGSPLELTTSYTEDQIPELRFASTAGVLFIFHPGVVPSTVTPGTSAPLTFNAASFGGPFLAINQTYNPDGNLITFSSTIPTMTPDATNGSVNLTVANWTFLSAYKDVLVGRYIALLISGQWGFGLITDVPSDTKIEITVPAAGTQPVEVMGMGPLGGTTATNVWKIGALGPGTYPSGGFFFEDRLGIFGIPGLPQRIDLSGTSTWTVFSPHDDEGTVAADNAISLSLAAKTFDEVKWASADEKGLLVGLSEGPWLIKSSDGGALTPANVSARRVLSYGASSANPLFAGKAHLYIQNSQRKVRELLYFYDVDGFIGPDLTHLAEHIGDSPIKQLALQQDPQSLVWARRDDGVLAALSYERAPDQLRAGWHRHILGGVGDSLGSAPVVESIAVVPSDEAYADEVWMIVKRYINGGVKRYVEYMRAPFNEAMEKKDAFHLDCGITYDGWNTGSTTMTLTDGTDWESGETVSLETSVSYFTEGDVGKVYVLKGSDGEIVKFTAAAYVGDQKVTGICDRDIPESLQDTATTDWSTTATTFTGADHLEGETVDILADGVVYQKTISSGSFTIDEPATTVHAGYSFNSDLKLLRINAGAADGTAQGKTRRTHRIGLDLYRTLGIKLGMSFDDLNDLDFETEDDALAGSPKLFTGIYSTEIFENYDFENQICIRASTPLPATVRAVLPQMMTQDRG